MENVTSWGGGNLALALLAATLVVAPTGAWVIHHHYGIGYDDNETPFTITYTGYYMDKGVVNGDGWLHCHIRDSGFNHAPIDVDGDDPPKCRQAWLVAPGYLPAFLSHAQLTSGTADAYMWDKDQNPYPYCPEGMKN